MKNGRENRNNGNQEKGKKEKETLRSDFDVKRGREKRPLSFLSNRFQSIKVKVPKKKMFSVVSSFRARLYQSWNALLLFGTQHPIGAEVAVHS